VREIRTLGSVRAKAEWLSYSTGSWRRHTSDTVAPLSWHSLSICSFSFGDQRFLPSISAFSLLEYKAEAKTVTYFDPKKSHFG